MTTTPAQFFTKNLKWITMIFVALFLFKSIQSCNRNVKLNMSSGQYIRQIDSINNEYSNYRKVTEDSIKLLNFELKLAYEHAKLTNEKAMAVQAAIEKIKSNTTTTVVVKGAEHIKD